MPFFGRPWSLVPACAALVLALALRPDVAAAAQDQTIACGWCESGAISVIDLRTSGTDVLTVDPAGNGESLEDIGATLRVRVMCSNGSTDPSKFTPAVGFSRGDIVLYNPALCICTPLMAASDTDAEGWTEFKGTFRVGGCAEKVSVFAEGLYLGDVALRINSPDTGYASPCAVDGSDLSVFARHLGKPALYDFCFDYNNDGAIDASDLALFGLALGTSRCR